ncbi:MAG: cbb3-type cytochrome oxidase assembly protein CcoS [Pseudomonadales bacterium]|jgi:cbb3-type cytochrome oxidase maturation protein|nr:cbb3-type cytochrome oxidase assembly protein CcoS [Pseudomonadales bacterium]MBP9032461.1 cbb3-type cytochrome oxidase assembly protein CcoS [Pseudomonadales bacterium]
MDSIYVLIPVTTILLGLAIAAYLWSVNSGQFDDLDKAARSILFDDTDSASPRDEPAVPAPAAEDEQRNRA